MSSEFRPAALVPTYDNPRTLRRVVEALRVSVPDVIVVDDGSGPEGRAAVEELKRDGLAHTIRREANGGKGAAMKTGFARASELGFTHVLQVDADGQHALEDAPLLLDVARRHPTALVLGRPIFDRSVPLVRLLGRQLTVFWTHVETGGRQVADPMCGFRVYPLSSIVGLRCADHMGFDIELAVRLVWRGIPVVNVPTKVRYVPEEEGGVSHFRMFEDNVEITWLHIRLVLEAILRFMTWPVRALVR